MITKIKALLFENKGMRHTVIKNTAWLFFGETIGRLLKLALVIYAARILGTEKWGVFSYVLSLAGVFSLFSDIGLNNLLTREMTKNGNEKYEYLSTIFSLKIILIFISACLLLIFAPHISKIPETNNFLFIMTALLVFDSMREFGIALNRASQKMETEAFIKILTNVSVSIIGLFFVFYMPTIKNILYVYVIGSALGSMVILYVLRKNFKNIFAKFSAKLTKPIFDFSWPFAILIFFGTIMTSTDVLMLGWLSTADQIGLYSIAQKLTQFLYLIPGLISIAIFPSFSKLAEEKDIRFNNIFEKVIRFLLLFGLPIVVGGIILSRDIIVLIFGAQYIAASATFSIMLGMVLVNYPTIIIDNAILAHNQQKRFLSFSIGAVILNIILNYILIPIYGVSGAAMATLASSAIAMFLVFIKFIKINKLEISFKPGKTIFATILMAVFILSLKHFGLNVIAIIALSICLYIGILYLLKDQILAEILPKNK